MPVDDVIIFRPERPQVKGSGPWWDKIHALSDTHALGWAEQAIIATTDGGSTWDTPSFPNDTPECAAWCDAKTSDAFYPSAAGGTGCGGSDCGAFRTIGELNKTSGTKSNVTGQFIYV